MKMNVFKGLKPWIAKHEPEILLGMGVSGFIFSTVWGIKATVKAVKKVDEVKEELGKDKLTNKEVIKIVWKDYIPVVVGIGLSVPAVISSNRVSNRRNAALAAAFSISERTLQEYQDKTREIVGDKKNQEIKESISADRVAQAPGTVYLTGDGDSVFYEPLSGRYFKTKWAKIQKAANDLNASALTDICGEVTLSDWFDALGLEPTDISDDLGWKVTQDGMAGLIQIEITSVIKDDQPCGSIEYRSNPKSLL